MYWLKCLRAAKWYYMTYARETLIRVPLIMVSVLSISFYGCIHGHCITAIMVSGQLVDSGTMEPVAAAALGGLTITNGSISSGQEPAFKPDGEPWFSSNVTGAFSMRFEEGSLTGCPPPDFTRPDQVEIIVLRDGCEQRFLIEVNEDTVVDLSFPNRTLELKNPILVPPCEEADDENE